MGATCCQGEGGTAIEHEPCRPENSLAVPGLGAAAAVQSLDADEDDYGDYEAGAEDGEYQEVDAAGLVNLVEPEENMPYSDWMMEDGTEAKCVKPTDVPPDDEFHVLVQKRQIGVEVDRSDGSCLKIERIAKDGLVQQWNRINPHVEVKEGDTIISVNGVRGNAEDMVNRIKKDAILGLVVRGERGVEKREFAVTVQQRTEKVGIDVDLTNGSTLVVESVNGGLIAEWNRNNKNDQIRVGDQIISVNGASGDAQELVDICKGENILLMVIKKRDENEDWEAWARANQLEKERSKQERQEKRQPKEKAPPAAAHPDEY